MATAVHIPFHELSSDARALLERADANGEIFIDREDTGFRIERIQRAPGRTAAETLTDPTIRWANVALDEHWAKDMQAIYGQTRREVQGRTAEEAAELMKTLPGADVEVDENWARDMEAILALRHAVPDRDPWA